MSHLPWSHCGLDFLKCLSYLGHIAVMEEFTFAKNFTKTRNHLRSDLEVIPAPFFIFFIANTLHHRLLAGSLLSLTNCVMGSNLVACLSLGARWPELISDSLSRMAGESWGEGVPGTHLIRRYSGVHCGNLSTLFTVALRLSRPVGYTGGG